MVSLYKKDSDQIIAHAKREFPLEVCGIIAGSSETNEQKLYEMINTDKSSETFLMEPKEQFAVLKDIRAKGLKMIAIYHSHPHTHAYPSAHDVDMAHYREVSYIIVTLKDADKPQLRSYVIVDGKITEEELVII